MRPKNERVVVCCMLTIFVIYEGATPIQQASEVGGDGLSYVATGTVTGVVLEKPFE